jgi:DNA-binding NtrC family response regulator
MNGHEAFFKLREIDPDVRVMLQSGYINQKDAQEVLQAGALGFLQKPYRMQSLAQKMRDILDA